MNLNDLKPGECGYVVKIRGKGAFRKRVMEMGFSQGRRVEMIRRAPLQDPLEFRLMDYDISLRRSEARFIEITTENDIQIQGYNGVINEEVIRRKIEEKVKVIDVALIGNPNCGKTTLFNFASGASEHVGNYSGVTVEAKKGSFRYRDYTINLIDLPGTYSLSAYSPEELFVRNYLFQEHPDVIINVLDGSNLERNLFLTTQLMETDHRMVIALNMYDELRKTRVKFDHGMLGEMLGIPFIPTVGVRNEGIEALLEKVIEIYSKTESDERRTYMRFGMEIEESIARLQKVIEKTHFVKENVSYRFYAIKLLEEDNDIESLVSRGEYEQLHELAHHERDGLHSLFAKSAEALIADARYGFISGALQETCEACPAQAKKNQAKSFDQIFTHKIWGYPIFLGILFLMFFATFFLGSFPMTWLENGISILSEFISEHMSDGPFKELLVDGVINGVGGVLIFLPNILILFLFISLLEDTGYMARVAFLMDRIMHRIGLHGKSFIPLVMGFGCNVPAVMATRTLENPTDRLLTILINPFFSCSARLPIYILLIGTFFPTQMILLPLIIYLSGVAMAAIVAIIFKKLIFRNAEAPFVMELPPYRMPTRKVIMRHMWFRASQYLRKMGSIILAASIIIWALSHFPEKLGERHPLTKQVSSYLTEIKKMHNSGNYQNIEHWKAGADSLAKKYEIERQRNSFIGHIGRAMEPIMKPLGYDWKISVSLVTGIAAKEVFVSTVSVLYGAGNDKEDSTHALAASGISQPAALGLLFFILLYFPCVAVIAAIRKETGGWKWALFTVFYTTGIAWLIAFAIKNIAEILI